MKRLSGVSKGFAIVMIVLMIALSALTIMERMGYTLMYTYVPMIGCGVLVLVLLAWGAVAIFRRLTNRTTRVVVGSLLGLGVAFIALAGLSLLMTFAQLSSLQPFNTVNLPNGERAVVLYTMDTGFADAEQLQAAEARMDERVAALAEAGVIEVTEGVELVDYPYESYGYVYTAYPRVMGFFVDAKARSEGFIYKGVASEAEMKYAYSAEDNTVRFYLENAEVGDEGEIILYFE